MRPGAGFERLLRADPGGFIYGVTTRPGVEVGTAIPPQDLREYARRFRGVGRGFGRDGLDERVVRGIVFARLADFVGGHAKVRPELARRVAALLDGPLPRVPLDGQDGAGEILPLMHVMAAVDSGDLVEGEGMALINGSPRATALAADVALHAGNRLRLAEAVFALSIEALAAPLDAPTMRPLMTCGAMRPNATVLQHLRGHLRGAVTSGLVAHQAPVEPPQSRPRCWVRPSAPCRRWRMPRPRRSVRSPRTRCTCPPVRAIPSAASLSTGGFHNGAAAPAINWLTASWADLALVAQRHGHRHAQRYLRASARARPGRPLSPGPPASHQSVRLGRDRAGRRSPGAGRAHPAARHHHRRQPERHRDAHLGAYRNQHRAAECLDSVLAILALVASQALFVTGRDPAPPLAGLLTGIQYSVSRPSRPNGKARPPRPRNSPPASSARPP